MFGAPAGTPTATCAAGVCVTSVQLAIPQAWSGRFWPRTGCSGSSSTFVCQTGQCGPPTGGNIDCTLQNATANQATLFELSAAGTGGIDNFDVSLVSGYNIPLGVTVQLPTDSPGWLPNTFYASGAQITQKVGSNTFNFTNGGSSGTSGAQAPNFPGVWTGSVADGTNLVWFNTGPQCQTSGCVANLLDTCPTPLQVFANDAVVACDAPANVCASMNPPSSCNPSYLPYYQCQNNGGAMDLFGHVLTLQSPNAETFVCFSAADCPAGTTCQLNPTFQSMSFALPAGAGVCTPVPQNGGCQSGTDGMSCGAFPFVEYQCETLANVPSNAQVCLPPILSGFGNLWWNAANWIAAGPSCTQDSGCSSNQKCLAAPVRGGAAQCTTAGGCACYNPQPCSSARGSNDGCPGPNQCLNKDGVPDGMMDGGTMVNCNAVTCYCGPQGVYSGVCGPTNPTWNTAASAVGNGQGSWPSIFKTACPVAYSYQFDDPSSNWSCPNTVDQLVGYYVQFCGVRKVDRDFNGDGKSDILWLNSSSGNVAVWLMNGGSVLSSLGLGNLMGWTPTVGDFNGDGIADILWQNTSSGNVALWFMNANGTVQSSLGLGNLAGWTPRVGDFNGDGIADILWQNTASGNVALWFMNTNGTVQSSIGLGNLNGWTPRVDDYNGDRIADILWQNTSGNVALWLMNENGTVQSSIGLGSLQGWTTQ